MSLLSGYSTLNKHTKVGLDVRYRHEIVDGGHLYTRYATKAYGYLGMTYAAAKECAAVKSAQYMRTHRRQSIKEETSSDSSTTSTTYSVDDKSVTERLCSISTTHGNGDAWDVEISVSETETVATLEEASDVEALFSAENAWEYDEDDEGGTPGVKLSAVSGSKGGSSISAKITATGISGFSASGAVLTVSQVSASGVAYWSCASASATGDGGYSCTFTGGTVPLATCTAFATCGTYVSNTVTFTPA